MIDNYMLFDNLPTIDLHGEDSISAIIKTDEFLNDNLKLKNKLVVVIHGVGKGILKREIHKFLKKDKRVLKYRIGAFNPGMTIVELK